jgi:hypothetical protein
MRARTLLAICLAVAAVAAVISVPLAFADHRAAQANPSSTIGPTGSPRVATQAAPPPPTLLIPKDPASITAPGTNYFGWTLIDRKTGQLAGSANAGNSTSTTESMIKAWIAADYLRGHDAPSSGVLSELTAMIVNSDDNIAEKYYKLNGGDPSITQLVQVCGLKDTQTPSLPTKWSYTQMSPADAARMGLCIANGTAAGPKWTSWLLTTMRNVKGTVAQQQLTSGGGRWGIIDGLPSYLVPTTSIKNGWTAQIYDHNWHVNCLAINTDWVLAIEIHYPWTSPTGNWHQASNLAFGANTCAAVTKQLVGVPDSA